MQTSVSEGRRQEVVSLLPPCMLSFSVPLLLPGVTITTVAFVDDNPGFPKYGALHVVGMMLLALSVVLVAGGITILCIAGKLKRDGARVKPLDEESAHAYSTHEKNSNKLSVAAQMSTHTRREGAASSGLSTRGDKAISPHTTHSHAAPVSSRPSEEKATRHPATGAATSTLSPARAVDDEPGVGQYSVSSCRDRNEVALSPLQPRSAWDGREPARVWTRRESEDSAETSIHTSPQGLKEMTSACGMSGGPDSQHSSSPIPFNVAQDRLAESSYADRPRVASLPSLSVESEAAGTRGTCRHQQTAAADYKSADDWERPAMTDDFQEISRHSHGTRNGFSTHGHQPGIHSISSLNSNASASVSRPEASLDCSPWAQSLAFNFRPGATRGECDTRQLSDHDASRDSGANLPEEDGGELPAADTHFSSEAESSRLRGGVEASELACRVDEGVCWTSGDGHEQEEATDKVVFPAFFDDGTSSCLLSRSSVSGVKKTSHSSSATENLFTRRSLDKSFSLQCQESVGRKKEGAAISREQRTSSIKVCPTPARSDDDNDAREVEFSGHKSKHSQEQRGSDIVSLVSIDQENISDIFPRAIEQRELCDRLAPEQMEVSDVSVGRNRSLSVFLLEEASDLQEGRSIRHKAGGSGVTVSKTSFQPETCTNTSLPHLAGVNLRESDNSQRPEDTAPNADAAIQRVKKVKKKKRGSRNVRDKTFDSEQTLQTTGGEGIASFASAVQPHCDTVMHVHLL